MWIYTRLAARLPRHLAMALTGLWFALLILLVIFLSFEPHVEFRYGNL